MPFSIANCDDWRALPLYSAASARSFPGNHFGELSAKFEFYHLYGVEEYYIFDPDLARS